MSTDIDVKFLTQYAESCRFRMGSPSHIGFTPEGTVLFLRAPTRSFVHDLYEWNPTDGTETVLLTANEILQDSQEQLSEEEKMMRERQRQASRGIVRYSLTSDGARILVPLSDRLFIVDRKEKKTQELPSGSYPMNPSFSPNDQMVACVRDGEVKIIDVATQQETKLSVLPPDSTAVTTGLADFIAQEEMDRYSGYWWSPDSQHIAYQVTDNTGLEEWYIMDPTRPGKAPAVNPYPRPGKKNAKVRLHIKAVDGKSAPVEVQWDYEQYEYLCRVDWAEQLTILVQSRRQTEELLLRVDVATGETSVLVEEKDEKWLNLDQTVPYWVDEGAAFLWSTERNGAWQLELRSASGELVREVTPMAAGYKTLVSVDCKTQTLVFLGHNGVQSQQHIGQVSYADPSTGVEWLSSGASWNSASVGSSHYVQATKCLARVGQWVVKDLSSNQEVGSIASSVEAPDFPIRAQLLVTDPTPDGLQFSASMCTPPDFDDTKKYPVIVYVYGGPHVVNVRADQSSLYFQQWLANHGFVVVCLDGRGTPAKGRDWERAIRDNFIRVPMADQTAGLQALGRMHSFMDMDRVGIYGWSFGGYFSAFAVMLAPEVYRCGFAGAPVCCWEDYDTHYTERYIGLPQENKEGYDDSNVLTHAHKTARPLFVVHGTADDNVYFSHALKMSNALFRAGKDHQFLPLVDFTHMVTDPVVTTALYSRLLHFFLQHLA